MCCHCLAPSTLDINTPKEINIKKKANLFIDPENVEELSLFNKNRNTPVKSNVKTFDTRNIDKVFNTIRKKKIAGFKNNQNHL